MSGARSGARVGGLGLSYRPETAGHFDRIDGIAGLTFCEIHVEDPRRGPAEIEHLQALKRAGLEICLHSVRLDFLAARFLENAAEVDAIADLAQVVGASLISGHLSSGEFMVGPVRSFDRPIYSEVSLEQVLRRLELARSRLGLLAATENVAYYGRALDDQIDEITFLNRLAAGGGLIVFDLSNHLANRTNRRCAGGELDALDSEGVSYVHISGGKWLGETYVDTHGDPIPDSHVAALVRLRDRAGPLRVLYERDIRYENRDEIRVDVDRVRRAIGG